MPRRSRALVHALMAADRADRHGFTLLEVLFVITIVVNVAARTVVNRA